MHLSSCRFWTSCDFAIFCITALTSKPSMYIHVLLQKLTSLQRSHATLDPGGCAGCGKEIQGGVMITNGQKYIVWTGVVCWYAATKVYNRKAFRLLWVAPLPVKGLCIRWARHFTPKRSLTHTQACRREVDLAAAIRKQIDPLYQSLSCTIYCTLDTFGYIYFGLLMCCLCRLACKGQRPTWASKERHHHLIPIHAYCAKHH